MNKSLFPEMDHEMREDRKAAKREQIQRARDWLKNRDISWLINYLLKNGPATEHVVMREAMDEKYHFKEACQDGFNALCDIYALWLVHKLWRRFKGIHPGSGERSYLYGIRGVHELPKIIREN